MGKAARGGATFRFEDWGFRSLESTGVIKWDPFWGNQTIQIKCIVWVGTIMTPDLFGIFRGNTKN